MLGPFCVHGADEEGLFQEDLKIRSGGFLAFNHFQSPLLESPNLSLQPLIRNKIHGNGMGYTYTTPQSINIYDLILSISGSHDSLTAPFEKSIIMFCGWNFFETSSAKKMTGDLGFGRIPQDSIGFHRI